MALVGDYNGDLEKGRFHGKGLHALKLIITTFNFLFAFRGL
jgi:hypothetical protein